MSAENTPNSGAGTLIAGGAALALVLAAMGWWMLRDTGEAPPVASGAPTAPTPLADPSATDAIAKDAPSEEGKAPLASRPPADPASPPAPRFDVVRVAPDGSAVIAGQAPSGADVRLMLDDTEVARTEADANGNFVALVSLPPESASRVMRLMVEGDDKQTSRQSVIIGPTAAPALTSEADPRPDSAAQAVSAGAPDAARTAGDTPGDAQAAEHGVEHGAEQGAETARAPGSDTGTPAPPTDTQTPETEQTDAQGANPVAPQVLLADQDGIRVLQDAGPATEGAPLSLDTIAYDAAGMVSLSGRGPAGAGLRISLDGVRKVEGEIGQDGQWQLALPPVDPGVYAMRVDALDATGAVSDSVETPFKREEPARLAALDSAATEPTPQKVPDNGGDATSERGANGGPDQPVTDPDPRGTNRGTKEAEAVPPSDTPAPAAATPDPDLPADTSTPRPTIVTVQPGATLWAIARDKLGEGTLYVQVFDANRDKIRNPDLIYPGQVFAVPEAQARGN